MDGSIKFWDASGCNFLFLYKLRTNRLFDRVQPTASSSVSSRETNTNTRLDTRTSRANSNTGEEQIQQQMNSLNLLNEFNGYDHPYAIYSIKMCCDGKYLIAAARGGHVTLFKFTGPELDKADEGLGDLSCLEIPILHRNLTGDHDETPNSGNSSAVSDLQSSMGRQSAEKKVKRLFFRSRGWMNIDISLGI